MPKKQEEQPSEQGLELEDVKVDEKKADADELRKVPISSANSSSITKKILSSERKVMLQIPSTQEDKSAVFVSINGVAFNIPRDKYVEVPYSVVHVLENAKMTQFKVIQDKNADAATVLAEDVSRIAFQTKAK